ncbi:MAG: phosphosulfolactate synthase [Rikenellaceae bacterium]
MEITHLPKRGFKPREQGITMVMDKGLNQFNAEGLCKMAAPIIDFVKLGFGTSLFTSDLDEKIEIYHKYGIKVYAGGTLFEAFLVRGMLQEYKDFVKAHNFDVVEISDGSIVLDHTQKCKLIEEFSAQHTVLSEVGSKVASVEITPQGWVQMMCDELSAGSQYVIAEGREAGNMGIFDSKGAARTDLIDLITSSVPLDKILWEAPTKSQQVWFVKQFGANVNLGNIAADEIISLETIRCGLRGDTFGLYLPEDLRSNVQR